MAAHRQAGTSAVLWSEMHVQVSAVAQSFTMPYYARYAKNTEKYMERHSLLGFI